MVLEISPVSLKEKLQTNQEMILIDVRQSWEYKICHIEGSQNIPLTALPDVVEEIPNGKMIVTICHHGVRSKQAAFMLSQFGGFSHVVSLQGGVEAWAQEIDPTMERY
jgi:rhodanese-related sulfurtransferase